MSLRTMYTLLLVVNYCINVNFIGVTNAMISLMSHAFSSQSWGLSLGPHMSSPVLYC